MQPKSTPLGILAIIATNVGVMSAFPAQATIIESRAFTSEFRAGTERNNNPITPLTIEILTTPPATLDLPRVRNLPGEVPVDPSRTNNITILPEKQGVTLNRNLDLWSGNGRDYEGNTYSYRETDVTIPRKTKVSSYFFYLTPPGDQRDHFFGSLTFDTNVLGIAKNYFTRGNPNAGSTDGTSITTELLGLDTVSYNFTSYLDNDPAGRDNVWFEDNTLYFDFSAMSGREPFRIITQAQAPEPLTLLGVATATGFGIFFKKKRG